MRSQEGLMSLREVKVGRFDEGSDLIEVSLLFEGKLGLIFEGIESHHC